MNEMDCLKRHSWQVIKFHFMECILSSVCIGTEYVSTTSSVMSVTLNLVSITVWYWVLCYTSLFLRHYSEHSDIPKLYTDNLVILADLEKEMHTKFIVTIMKLKSLLVIIGKMKLMVSGFNLHRLKDCIKFPCEVCRSRRCKRLAGKFLLNTMVVWIRLTKLWLDK